MANIFGADVEQLRRLGHDLGNQSTVIESMVNRLSAQVSGIAWRGPDAQRFQLEWRDRLAVQLRKTAAALQIAGESATRNAQEQEQVSGGSLGGLPGITLPSGESFVGGIQFVTDQGPEL